MVEALLAPFPAAWEYQQNEKAEAHAQVAPTIACHWAEVDSSGIDGYRWSHVLINLSAMKPCKAPACLMTHPVQHDCLRMCWWYILFNVNMCLFILFSQMCLDDISCCNMGRDLSWFCFLCFLMQCHGDSRWLLQTWWTLVGVPFLRVVPQMSKWRCSGRKRVEHALHNLNVKNSHHGWPMLISASAKLGVVLAGWGTAL